MFTRTWWLSTGERLVKTFIQGYVALWLLRAGIADPTTVDYSPDAFDALFSVDNVKAGVVAAVLSFVTSVATTPIGPDPTAPSAVITESPPTA